MLVTTAWLYETNEMMSERTVTSSDWMSQTGVFMYCNIIGSVLFSVWHEMQVTGMY